MLLDPKNVIWFHSTHQTDMFEYQPCPAQEQDTVSIPNASEIRGRQNRINRELRNPTDSQKKTGFGYRRFSPLYFVNAC